MLATCLMGWDLVKDGDALLGSLIFTRDAKYHEPLGPLVAK